MNSMAMLCSLAAVITSSSRMEPPGWAMAVMPPVAAISMLSANGKKASEANTLPCALSPEIRSARWTLNHTVRLPRAHAYQRVILGKDDGIGLDVLCRPPCEIKVGKFGISGLPLGNDIPGAGRFGNVIDLLH